jgi:hypothetical protein
MAVLFVPALLIASDKVSTGSVSINADNTITVPLNLTNSQDGLMAVDIPLKFSEGVTLKEVNFDETRVNYFDLKLAKIDNDNNTVIIGLISQATAETKENLAAGEGVVANLVFEVQDPSVSNISFEAIKTEYPHHELTYIYTENDGSAGITQTRVNPDFGSAALSLTDESVPATFSLEQNYPNPFNPSTVIAFGIPTNSHVRLTVFNLLGQEVQTLVDGNMSAGTHEVTWDGTNSSGSSVASGVYFYRVEAGQNVETRKMMLLK